MIPNVFHFIFGLEKKFGNKPFSIFHYLAIKSVLINNNPDKICFYYKYEPYGIWWDKIKGSIEKISVSVPRKIFGNKLYHYAHKSDVLRLLILIKFGGIYLDMDTICIQSFSSLLNHQCVMGEERFQGNVCGLCNAVILSTKESEFLRSWIDTYRYFRSTGYDRYWGEHSVKIPLLLARKIPEKIHIETDRSFFYPSYTEEDLERLFVKCENFPNAFLFHLWESKSYEKYLLNLSEEYIKSVDTSYNSIARRYF